MRPDPHPAPDQVLVVDAGSSMTKLALVTGGDMARLGSFATGGTGAVGWEARFDAALVDAVGPDSVTHESVTHVALSSVVPGLSGRLRAWWEVPGRGSVPVRVVGTDSVDLLIDHQPPSALGSDRLANAVAAVERAGAPVIVVDVGTAITCDLVAAGPRFAGGAIAPGPFAAYQGLVDRAPRLALGGGLPLHDEMPVVARTTAEAVRAGVLHGAAGLVDGLVRRLRRVAGPCPVIATGGRGATRARPRDTITSVDADLTLWGIHLASTTTATQRRPGTMVATGPT